jgi:hypothetical protein
MIDVSEAMQAGGDIVTVPSKFLPQMCVHPKTAEAVPQLVRDFQEWSAPAPVSLPIPARLPRPSQVART